MYLGLERTLRVARAITRVSESRRTLFPLSGADPVCTTGTRGCTHMFRPEGFRRVTVGCGGRVGRCAWHCWRSGVLRRVVRRVLRVGEVRRRDVRVRSKPLGCGVWRVACCRRIVGAARRMGWRWTAAGIVRIVVLRRVRLIFIPYLQVRFSPVTMCEMSYRRVTHVFCPCPCDAAAAPSPCPSPSPGRYRSRDHDHDLRPCHGPFHHEASTAPCSSPSPSCCPGTS